MFDHYIKIIGKINHFFELKKIKLALNYCISYINLVFEKDKLS